MWARGSGRDGLSPLPFVAQFVIPCEKVDSAPPAIQGETLTSSSTPSVRPRAIPSSSPIACAQSLCSFSPPAMAPNMRPLAMAASQVQLAGRRTFTTQRPSLIASRAQWTPRPIQQQIALRQSIRRATTDAKPPKPKKRFRLLRWTWRLTYLSAIAGLGWVGYGIYETRTPGDQPQPDPSKKTLVVLGMSRDAMACIRRMVPASMTCD